MGKNERCRAKPQRRKESHKDLFSCFASLRLCVIRSRQQAYKLRAAAAGIVVSATVAALVEGVLKAMVLNNLKKLMTVVVLVVLVAVLSAGVWVTTTPATQPESPQTQAAKEKAEEMRIRQEVIDAKKLHDLFGSGRVNVFIDNNSKTPFIENALFDREVTISGRKFLQFVSKSDGRHHRHLVDPTRVVGLVITD
jgi:hypothetical protein